MRLIHFSLMVFAILPTAHADVTSELVHMLAKYPEADANRDGTLTEEEAGNYILRSFQRKRPNRGPGIQDRALINVYEARAFEILSRVVF